MSRGGAFAWPVTIGKEMEPKLTSLASGGGCGCKLAPHVLKDILQKMPVPAVKPDLLIDASTSDDAAVYRMNDEQAIVATTDFFAPVVDDPYQFGRIAATNALSDIYAMGATPMICLAIVGMPVATLSAETIQQIVKGGADVANAAGAPVVGGHSIDTAEPIYGLIALGQVHPNRIKTNAGARVGDKLVLTKPLGIGIYSSALKKGLLSDEGYAQMIASTTQLNTPGAELSGLEGVHALTDVTGFGLLGHALELAKGAGVDLVIDRSSIPVFEEARRLAEIGVKTGASDRNWHAVSPNIARPEDWIALDEALWTDPQTSGGLLMSVAPDSLEKAMQILGDSGFSAACVIGEVAAGSGMVNLR